MSAADIAHCGTCDRAIGSYAPGHMPDLCPVCIEAERVRVAALVATYELGTVYCTDCGSTNVQAAMWVCPNDDDYVQDPFGTFGHELNSWCEGCEDHTRLRMVDETDGDGS